ncbi:MAG: alkaline phosphatase D family protein [Cyclobacteriaceae bacterium]
MIFKNKQGIGPLLLLFGTFLFACQSSEETPLQSLRIAFGSCNRTDLPQVMWEPINKNMPDVFVWLGDIVYGDTHDMTDLEAKYKKVKNEPGYISLSNHAEIIGVWDDHDYGWNDSGKNYGKKDSSQQLLLDFLDISDESPLRQQEGVYSSHVFGKHPVMTKIILLDARFFRDTVIADPDPARRYTVNETGDVLGEQQWRWLEKELRSTEADVHIIGSGIQVIPTEHGWEKWANFPRSRQRLFDLIRSIKPKNTLMISGDRHIAEFSKIELGEKVELYEATSSGLTHTWNNIWEEPNQHRVKDMVIKKNFGIIEITPQEINVEIRGEMDSLYNKIRIPQQ